MRGWVCSWGLVVVMVKQRKAVVAMVGSQSALCRGQGGRRRAAWVLRWWGGDVAWA